MSPEKVYNNPRCSLYKAVLPKVAAMDFGTDRKKDGTGGLNVEPRRAFPGNAPVPDFCETPEDTSRLFAEPPVK